MCAIYFVFLSFWQCSQAIVTIIINFVPRTFSWRNRRAAPTLFCKEKPWKRGWILTKRRWMHLKRKKTFDFSRAKRKCLSRFPRGLTSKSTYPKWLRYFLSKGSTKLSCIKWTIKTINNNVLRFTLNAQL